MDKNIHYSKTYTEGKGEINMAYHDTISVERLKSRVILLFHNCVLPPKSVE